MNWNEMLTATGILSSYQIIIVVLVGYFFKMRFENKLDKSIESHKKELQKELDIHKHELDKLKTNYEIRLDKFFDKKANALAEIFESLTDLKFAM